MARLSPLTLDAAREVCARYGLDISEIEALDLGSVNSNFRLRTRDGGRYFARIYEEQPKAGAEAEAALLLRLFEQAVPVVSPLQSRGGSPIELVQGKPFAVFPWVDGESLCLQRVDSERCRLVGDALARAHQAQVPRSLLGSGRFQPSDMLGRLDRVQREHPGWLGAEIDGIRTKYAEYTRRRDDALPHGVCHGDLFRDNVLWQGPRIAALLDFESVSFGSFVYDLMVTVFAWCYRSELGQENARALVEGYDARRPLSSAELAAFEVESALVCLRFATTRITDFELRRSGGAPPVRDFRRFLARLSDVESGVLRPIREQLEQRAPRSTGSNEA